MNSKEKCVYCDKEIEDALECDDCKKRQWQQDLRSRVESLAQCIATLKSEQLMLQRDLCRSLGCGDPKCSTSTGICEHLTFGKGDLNPSGYWEEPCWDCARAHQEIFPESGECWPFREEYRKEVVAILEGSKKSND